MYEEVADGMDCGYEELPTRVYCWKSAVSSEKEDWAKALELQMENLAVTQAMAGLSEEDFPAEEGATGSWEQRVKVCCAVLQEHCV